MALDLGAGDAFIVPSITFLATANAPHLSGAEVEFADVASDRGLMTARTLGAARGLRLRAVFPVHLNGQSADMRALAEQLAGFVERRAAMTHDDLDHVIEAPARAVG